MNNCAVCEQEGKYRLYFFKNKLLCNIHYIDYLQFLIKGMDEEVTIGTVEGAYGALMISLKPEPPKPSPKPYNDPYSTRMRM